MSTHSIAWKINKIMHGIVLFQPFWLRNSQRMHMALGSILFIMIRVLELGTNGELVSVWVVLVSGVEDG